MLAVAAALLLANVTGLAADTGARQSIESQPLIRSVLWMGDSIAYDLAPGVVTALEQGGLRADVFAFAGVSLTGGAWLFEDQTWLGDIIPGMLAGSPANVVVWQLSRFDSPFDYDANLAAHTTFVDLALPGRVAVVFVTAPPIRPDAVPAGWPENWVDLTDIAQRLAERHPGRVLVADASAVWGSSFVGQADDGVPLRKPDGVHVCPLGAARFGDFLARWIDDHFAGIAPTDPATWPLDWWSDERYAIPSEDDCAHPS